MFVHLVWIALSISPDDVARVERYVRDQKKHRDCRSGTIRAGVINSPEGAVVFLAPGLQPGGCPAARCTRP
jgi:hypothetical protein